MAYFFIALVIIFLVALLLIAKVADGEEDEELKD